MFNRHKTNGKQSTNSRIDSILTITKLENRRLTGNEEVDNYINANPNFSTADINVCKLRKQTDDYLNEALSNG